MTATNGGGVPQQWRICIEGNIGAGKSKLIGTLEQFLQTFDGTLEVIVEYEKIDQPLLNLFNQNPAAYGLQFQQSMMEMRLEMMRRSYKYIESARARECACVVLIDTGPLREIAFTNANARAGNINAAAAQQHIDQYLDRLTNTNADIALIPEHIVLLNPSTNHCVRNITNRGRANEHLLSREYLEHIRQAHIDNVETLTSRAPQVQVHRVENHDAYTSICQVFELIDPNNLFFPKVDNSAHVGADGIIVVK